MCAGHGYAATLREDAGEGRGPGDDGYGAPPGLEKLGVRGGDSGGDHHLLGVPDLLGGVANVYCYPHLL
jgi:hypothetical protein